MKISFLIWNREILVCVVDKFKISQTDRVIQTWWRSKTLSHDSEAVERLVHFVCERACGERLSSPRYLTRGGTKNKRQYTLTSGKCCIYKAKPHFTWCDINYAIITWENWIRHRKDSWFQTRNWLSFSFAEI